MDSFDFRMAVNDGDIEAVRTALETGVDVNIPTPGRGDTALHVASRRGHDEIVELIIKSGADLNVTNNAGVTALHAACKIGRGKVVDLLIKNGADFNVTNKDGVTALHKAYEHGHDRIVELLIQSGADLNVNVKYTNTVMHKACEHGRDKVVELLTKSGADLNATDENGVTPLDIACVVGHDKIVELIVKNGGDLNVSNKNGDTVLHKACEYGRVNAVELLTKKGADLNATNKDGYAPLQVASAQVRERVVELFIKKGVDLQATYKHGNTLLHYASQRGHGEIAQLLINTGADLNVTNEDGDTALHKACRKGHDEVVELLIKSRANLRVTNREGRRPVDVVLRLDRRVQLLLETETLKQEEYSQLVSSVGSQGGTTVKLFLCGDGQVGKTSLETILEMTGFFEGIVWNIWSWFRMEEVFNPTPGVNVSRKDVWGIGRLSVHDFAGQAEFYVTHAMLLRTTNAIFPVVYKITDIEKEQKRQIHGWLSFISCSNADPTNKPRIVLIASHADKLSCQDTGLRRAKALLDHYRELFHESLAVSSEVFLINCTEAGSPEIQRLREVFATLRINLLKQRPQVPIACVQLLAMIEGWREERTEFPVMGWQDYLTAVRQATSWNVQERIVQLASSYLHDEGEIIYLRPKTDSLVVLDPQWLFMSVFGTLLAPDNFPIDKVARTAQDYVTLEELTRVFSAVADIDLLIKLLQDFQLCHTYDGRTFIFPSLLQQEMEEAAWSPVTGRPVYFGLQIRCRTEIDSFSCDLFPRLQTLLMQAHPDQLSRPLLWKNSAKCTDGKAEALLQITQDKRHLNIFVRSNDGNREDCNSIMDFLKDMTYRLLQETSPGARSRDMVLSALDLREHRPQPHAYSWEEVEAAAAKGENIVHPQRNVPEKVKDLLLHLSNLQGPKSHQRDDEAIEVGRDSALAWCMPIVVELKPPWRELGKNLGLSKADMERISKRHQDDTGRCCLAVLEEWLHLPGTNATVEGLKSALDLAGHGEIVDKFNTMERSMKGKLLELQSEVTDIVHANFPKLNFVPDKNKEADARRKELNRRTLREEVFSHSFNFSLDSVILDRLQERKKSVCRINWPGGSGTGFLLSKGKVLTCYHVYRWMNRALWSVHEASQYTATFAVSIESEYKVPFESPAALLICYDKDLDYAILQLAVVEEMERNLESLPLLGHLISESEDSRKMVVLVGHPSGGNKMVDFGCIAGAVQRYIIHVRFPNMIQEDERKPLYDTSVMFHGSSGSPGFDTYGNVVLMHTKGFLDDGGQSVIERGVRLSAVRDHARQNLTPEVFKTIFPASFEQLTDSLSSLSID